MHITKNSTAIFWTLAVILVLTTVASYWYYLRVAWFMWMRPGSSDVDHTGVRAPLPNPDCFS